jgi:hypothetical protein
LLDNAWHPLDSSTAAAHSVAAGIDFALMHAPLAWTTLVGPRDPFPCAFERRILEAS